MRMWSSIIFSFVFVANSVSIYLRSSSSCRKKGADLFVCSVIK